VLQLQFWKKNDPTVGYREDVILSNQTSMLFCPPLSNSSKHLSRRHGNGQVRARTFHLWPYTWVTAGVRVLNGRMPGDLSNTVQFRTLEDSKSRPVKLLLLFLSLFVLLDLLMNY